MLGELNIAISNCSSLCFCDLIVEKNLPSGPLLIACKDSFSCVFSSIILSLLLSSLVIPLALDRLGMVCWRLVVYSESVHPPSSGEERYCCYVWLADWRNPGGGKKMHSVFDDLLFLPMCISRPNFLKSELISVTPVMTLFWKRRQKLYHPDTGFS